MRVDQRTGARHNLELRRRGWHRGEPREHATEGHPSRTRQLVLRTLGAGLVDEDRARQVFPGLAAEQPKPSPVVVVSVDGLARLMEGAGEDRPW